VVTRQHFIDGTAYPPAKAERLPVVVPRYTEDPRPGQPFPLSAQPPEEQIPDDRLRAEAAELRSLLR